MTEPSYSADVSRCTGRSTSVYVPDRDDTRTACVDTLCAKQARNLLDRLSVARARRLRLDPGEVEP